MPEYCVHQGLPEPKYTKYVHHQGYRHEVEVGGGTYFGSLKYYSQELQSKQGAAHVALYDVLVRDDRDGVETGGLPNLRNSNEALLAVIPRDPRHISTGWVGSRGDLSPEQFNETPLAVAPQNPYSPPTEPRVSSKRNFEEHEESRRVKRRGGRSKPPINSSRACKPTPGNANLQPLENCRLAAVKAPVVEEQRRWKVTPSEISRKLREVGKWVAKLESKS